ncbi:hypothetical protein I7I53_04119 [Histoplasma capsulatum var. duboisii H88]|uniref:Uncharacterized protein n=1 Tax=Ajellomyces capsulatus (strain H88) TaxID=544711 RepID=A0A8A1LP05_AJEC8|nr:hypothetical protein I7I53_04119 [Histoplasma capsulatum var. duboisii H88]
MTHLQTMANADTCTSVVYMHSAYCTRRWKRHEGSVSGRYRYRHIAGCFPTRMQPAGNTLQGQNGHCLKSQLRGNMV